jgi:hypothetical protein
LSSISIQISPGLLVRSTLVRRSLIEITPAGKERERERERERNKGAKGGWQMCGGGEVTSMLSSIDLIDLIGMIWRVLARGVLRVLYTVTEDCVVSESL